MRPPLSRRSFLAAAGVLGAAMPGRGRLWAAAPGPEDLHLGMMLQAKTLEELLPQAAAIAAVGFDTVQLTFFFEPTLDELQRLSATLQSLHLRVAAFGTYFNLFRPDDPGFMGCSRRTLQLLAAHPGLFGCRQFISWSASHAPKFPGPDPRNHSQEAVVQLQRAIQEVILPVLDPIDGRLAFEPFYQHVLATPERGKEIFAPFPVNRIGLVMDPPNFISPELYPRREEEMRRLFQLLGDRIHLVHFKDMKLDGGKRIAPGPGDGEMDYPLFLSELRKLHRPFDCIVEHIKAEPAVMSRTKQWVEAQLGRP